MQGGWGRSAARDFTTTRLNKNIVEHEMALCE